MSHSARKKERHRLKRKQKQKLARRQSSITVLQRIAREGGELECWINEDWKEAGQASLQVLARARDGRYAFAAFLVDVWCVGLKDAVGRSDVDAGAIRERAADAREGDAQIVPVDAGTARRLVAGSVRFARQNGFRLPADWQKFAAVLGDLGDLAAADLSDFGWEDGGLHYVGTLEFLASHLIGSTVPEFLSRPGVHYTIQTDQPTGDFDDEDEAMDEDALEDEARENEQYFEELTKVVDLLTDRLADAVRRWRSRQGLPVSDRLKDGAALLLGGLSLRRPAEPGADPELEGNAELFGEAALRLLGNVAEEDRPAVEDAAVQVAECVKHFGSPEQILKLADDPDLNSGAA